MGRIFNKHKFVFFLEGAWFLEMSLVESKKGKGCRLTLPKFQCCEFNNIMQLSYNIVYLKQNAGV